MRGRHRLSAVAAAIGWLIAAREVALAQGTDSGAVACVIEGGWAPSLVTDPIDTLERRLGADSNDAVRHYDLALGYWSQQRYPEAERQLRAALDLEPRFPAAMLALSYIPFACRPTLAADVESGRLSPAWSARLNEARYLRRRAFLFDPLVDLTIIGAAAPPMDLSHLYESRQGRRFLPLAAGIRMLYTGHYQEAYDSLQLWATRAVEEQDSVRIPGPVLWFRGLAAGHLKRYDLAIRDLTLLLYRAERKEADSVSVIPFSAANEFRYLLAELQRRAGHMDQALQLYLTAAQENLGLVPAHIQLARIYEGRREWDSAIKERQRAIDADPDDPDLKMELGITLFDAGRRVEAEPPLREVASSRPRNYRSRYYLGIIAAQQERPAEARTYLAEFINLAPIKLEAQREQVRQFLATLP
jgi:tetratricopeptide (TPR) repeat protein